MSEEELNLIRQGNIDGLGNQFNKKVYTRQNNHRYRKGKKYIHFYKDKSSLELIRREIIKGDNAKKSNHYFCSFNVPDIILWLYRGKGHYDGNLDTPTIDVIEYAIPTTIFRPEWLDKCISDDKTQLYISEKDASEVLDSIKNGTYKASEWGDDLVL